MMTTDILTLSTAVLPPKTFTIDEESYDLLSPKYFDPLQEARLDAILARYARLGRLLAEAKDDTAAEKSSMKLRTTRMDLIVHCTTVPDEVANRLPLDGQMLLLDAISTEFMVSLGGKEEKAPEDAD
jgi:hypothetical protein